MTASRRRAPAFQLEVRAPFLWRALHGVVWTLALAAGTAALALQVEAMDGRGAAVVCAGVAGLLWPLLAGWAWRHAAGCASQLLWDGEGWSLRDGPARHAAQEDADRQAVEVTVSLDLGGFLLLCCRPLATEAGGSLVTGAARFLPLSRRHHPGAWLPLRWALFAARRPPPGLV
ncbi:hypothetical protein QRD43_13405 [Pelomonas sp. APW6]|uniref:Uncharacterized protein n=1 Tax=Roseateles subflavus TaxID=3053353 RepID=A0ABT7LN37_9BURK|nr:hypothetical protein [Pelomonas sp. APW6]MDL5032906.1 hypothetical protein [Pelomonas sp. APW6]